MLIDKFPSTKRGRSSLSIRCKCSCGTKVKLTDSSDIIPYHDGAIKGYSYECPYCLKETMIPQRKWNNVEQLLMSNNITEKTIDRIFELTDTLYYLDDIKSYELLCLQKETGMSISKVRMKQISERCNDVLEAFNKGYLPAEYNATAFNTWKYERTNAHRGGNFSGRAPDYRILKVANVTKRNSNGYIVPDKIVLRGNDDICIILKVDNKGNVTEEWTESGINFDRYYVNGFNPY